MLMMQKDITKAFQFEEHFDPSKDKNTWCILTPIRKPSEALAALPNGYFDGYLTPFENFTLAEYFYKKHGYELFGIEASSIAFLHQEPASKQVAEELVRSEQHLYHNYDDQGFKDRMIEAVVGKRYFLVRYNGG